MGLVCLLGMMASCALLPDGGVYSPFRPMSVLRLHVLRHVTGQIVDDLELKDGLASTECFGACAGWFCVESFIICR